MAGRLVRVTAVLLAAWIWLAVGSRAEAGCGGYVTYRGWMGHTVHRPSAGDFDRGLTYDDGEAPQSPGYAVAPLKTPCNGPRCGKGPDQPVSTTTAIVIERVQDSFIAEPTSAIAGRKQESGPIHLQRDLADLGVIREIDHPPQLH